MAKKYKISENESVGLESIAEISEVLEFRNSRRKFFCFTLVFQDNRIINIIREYENGNRNLKKLEIDALHKGLIEVQPKLVDK